MIIETSVAIIKHKFQEITGVVEFITVKMSFNLSDVTAFRQSINEDENEIDNNNCVIYLKSGEYFFINTPYHTILELIDL
jgi:pullulanase/glycogen debranching enzyme